MKELFRYQSCRISCLVDKCDFSFCHNVYGVVQSLKIKLQSWLMIKYSTWINNNNNNNNNDDDDDKFKLYSANSL